MKSTIFLLLVLGLSFPIWAQAPPSGCCPQHPTHEKQQALWKKLEDRIAEIDEHLDGVMGVAIRDLANGDTYLLHDDDIFPQASSSWLNSTTRNSAHEEANKA